ncbi:MAG: hypothetical protein JWP44_3010 [Mucilaginibacter sp.]|nr:hypothetical protein [Mucilaginibacter sp.]
MDPYLAAILLFAGNFAPRNFLLCAGQVMSIQQNTALFSLLGTTYGGNGTNTFALPDLRGRAAIQQGQGPGLTNYALGETTGYESSSLLPNQMAIHNHLINAVTAVGTTGSPAGAFLAEGPSSGTGPRQKITSYYISGSPNVTMNPQAIGLSTAGGNNPIPVIQPYLAITYIIAAAGIFPARN